MIDKWYTSFIPKARFVLGGNFNNLKKVGVESSGCFSGRVYVKDHIKQTDGSAVIVNFPSPQLVIRYHCCLGEAVNVFLRRWSLV